VPLSTTVAVAHNPQAHVNDHVNDHVEKAPASSRRPWSPTSGAVY
jgi:hypothetical protein